MARTIRGGRNAQGTSNKAENKLHMVGRWLHMVPNEGRTRRSARDFQGDQQQCWKLFRKHSETGHPCQYRTCVENVARREKIKKKVNLHIHAV